MSRRALGPVVALLWVFVGAACGGDRSAAADGGPDATPTDPIAAFCQEVSARICDGLSACGCRFDVRPYDASTCVATRTATCTASFTATVGADLAAGRARLDDAARGACLTELTALADQCTLAGGLGAPLPEACAHVAIASAAVGAACEVSGTAFCGASGEGLCVAGTCTALPEDGDACLEGLCGAGLRCDGGVCAPPGASGAPCTAPAACGAGLVCTPAGTCGAPRGVDAGCDTTEQCAAGLRCEGGSCRAAVALGDGCADPSECGAARSCGRAPETRTCTTADGEGQACMPDTCAGDLACSGEPAVCTALPGAGDACLDGFACAPGHTCQDGTGICVALPGLGQPCETGGRFCQDGLGCRESDQTCQPGPGAGEACLLNPPDYVCAAGLGCDFGTSGSVCQPLGGAGTPCNTDRTCTAETYCELSTLACTARLVDGADCEDGNECREGSECVIVAGRAQCAKIPGAAEPCVDACDDDLACKGPGGACVPAFCVMPG